VSAFDKVFDEAFGYTGLFAGFFGLGAVEVPASVPLRILGLEELPATSAALKTAFRRRVMELHPDLGNYSAIPGGTDAVIALAKTDVTVQEVVWARDVLAGKVPSVTTGESRSRGQVATRNKAQDRLDELAAQIEREREDGRRHWGTVERAAEDRLRALANLDCRWCSGCGRDLGPDEPVWRLQRTSYGIVTHCDDCTREVDRAYYVKSHGKCATCGRLVHDARARASWLLYCCDRCRQAPAAARRAERRADARAGRKCEQCDEVIDASRNDAVYCSSACRQKAYRQRHRPAGNPITEEET
jgi:hypothetical protein